MPRTTILEYLDNFRDHARETAYVYRRGYRVQHWSYGDVLISAYRFARELDARGIGHSDKVLLWGENCAEWVAAFFGCVLRGVVVVPIDNIAAADFAERVAQQVDAKLCIGGHDHDVAGVPRFDLETLRESVAQRSTEPVPSPTLTRDDIVEIVFTSGTTAEPRGVVITHGNILANLEPLEREIGKYLKYERIFHPIRFLNLLPLSHVFGQFLGILLPQLLAGTVIFHDSLNPTEIIRLVREQRVSVVVAVPRLMESLKDKIERDMESAGRRQWFEKQFAAANGEHFVRRWWRFRRLHSQFGWKFWAFISGGAALDAETEEFWRRLSFVVIQGYGLTETTSLISLNHPFRTGKRSIGKVLEGREMKLDESGEILVRGANVAAGYWQGNQLKPVLNEEGWFRTGDLGEVDAEGNLYFRGRKKNVIVNREGMNIYPDDLEAALRHQPEVRDCVVVPLEQGGNAEPCAALLLRDSSDPESGGAGCQSAARRISAHAPLAGMAGARLPAHSDAEAAHQPDSGVCSSEVLGCGRSRRVPGLACRIDQPHHRAQRRFAVRRLEIGRRTQSQLHGSRRVDERAGRFLPGRFERGQFREPHHRRRTGAPVATAGEAGAQRISLSALGVALAGHVDSHRRVQPAIAAGDAHHGASAH